MRSANHSELREVASLAAKEAVKETFLMPGVNISTPEAVQSGENQPSTLRNIHYSLRHVRNVIIAGIPSVMVAGAIGAFWIGFKVSAAVPAPVAPTPGGAIR